LGSKGAARLGGAHWCLAELSIFRLEMSHMRRSNFSRTLALISLVVVASCDAVGDGSFTLTLSDGALSLAQSRTDTVLVSVSRVDYKKQIALTAEGAGDGIDVDFEDNIVSPNSNGTFMILTVSPTAELGLSTITVRATGEGRPEQATSIDVTVGITGAFTLSTSGFPQTAAQSGGAIGTVLVQRTGGHGDFVTLGATGLPSGVTASFGSPVTTSTATPVTFSAASGATPGSYNITITGDAPGLTQQTTPITLDVIAPPATATLTMPFCTTNVPSWFAYKNHGNVWQNVTGTNGVFTFPATSSVGVAYAFATSTGGQSILVAYFGTRAELGARGVEDCTGPKSVTGSIGGATAGQTGRISMGAPTVAATQAAPNFTLTGIADRVLDLIGVKGTVNTNNTGLQVSADKFLIQRGLNPANGSSLGTLDFTASGFAPFASNLTIANTAAGDSINVGVRLWTGTNSKGILQVFQGISTTPVLNSIPAGQMNGSDMHELLVETWRNDFSGRLNYAYLGAITDRTETLAPNLSTPTFTTISRSPYTRIRGQLPVQAEYPSLAFFEFYQDNPSTADRVVDVVVSAGYLGGTPATTWNVEIPEFGNVAGLNLNWLPSTPLLFVWAEADGGFGEALFGGKPIPGDVLRWGYRNLALSGLVRADDNRMELRAERGINLRATLPRSGVRQYFRR
jgi:hypothetical protein